MTTPLTGHRALRLCPREGQTGTWLNEEMKDAYRELHLQDYAHSAEAWLDGELVGGYMALSWAASSSGSPCSPSSLTRLRSYSRTSYPTRNRGLSPDRLPSLYRASCAIRRLIGHVTTSLRHSSLPYKHGRDPSGHVDVIQRLPLITLMFVTKFFRCSIC